MRPLTSELCYLCEQKLDSDVNKDHIPPRQFFPKSLRESNNLNLFTLPTHTACNKAYQSDEEYFVNSLGPLAMTTTTGNALWKDISKSLYRPKAEKLKKMILSEFVANPTIHLPNGLIKKETNDIRTHNVIWKITKGLYFKEFNKILPDKTLYRIQIYSRIVDVPEEFEIVKRAKSKGNYPEIFDYKYVIFPEISNFNAWGFLLWSHFICTIYFHDPDCLCEHCKTLDPGYRPILPSS